MPSGKEMSERKLSSEKIGRAKRGKNATRKNNEKLAKARIIMKL